MADETAASRPITFITPLGEPVTFPASDFVDLWAWGDGQVILKHAAKGGAFSVHAMHYALPDQTEFLADMLQKLRAADIPAFKIHIGSLVSPFVPIEHHYACVMRADSVALWSLQHNHKSPNPALPIGRAVVIDQHSFYLDDDELADFYGDLYQSSDPADWLRFSSAEKPSRRLGHDVYAARRDRLSLVGSFQEATVALGADDRTRIIVPMADDISADAAIRDIGLDMPHMLALNGGIKSMLIHPDHFHPHRTTVRRIGAGAGRVADHESWHVRFQTHQAAINGLMDLKLQALAVRVHHESFASSAPRPGLPF